MAEIDKVKFLDSGTALFEAAEPEAAIEKVRSVLLQGGGSVERQGEILVLDYSTPRFWQFIEARVEATSVPGRYAAAFREGNASKWFRFALPSRAARRRMDAIRQALNA